MVGSGNRGRPDVERPESLERPGSGLAFRVGPAGGAHRKSRHDCSDGHTGVLDPEPRTGGASGMW